MENDMTLERARETERAELYDLLREQISHALKSKADPLQRLQLTCDLLLDGISQCQWAGYYIADPLGAPMLLLGPSAGPATEHTRIAFGQGVCGQAASTLKTFVIDDVSSESNYLSCSPDVKSEIVVPVLSMGEFVGELDLDSHYPGGFGDSEKNFLQWLALIVSEDARMVRESMCTAGASS